MSPLEAKILIVGVPLVLSLGWFIFWVVRLTRAGSRMKKPAAPVAPAEPVAPAAPAAKGADPTDPLSR